MENENNIPEIETTRLAEVIHDLIDSMTKEAREAYQRQCDKVEVC